MSEAARRTEPTWSRAAKALLVVCIVAYGAALRLTAITETYGPVTRPGWLQTLQSSLAGSTSWRPDRMQWTRTELFPHKDASPSQYRSDPYTYLQYAREMRNFYGAHRREPLFPFATKVSLALLSDQDTAVSFASASFSVLTIAATFALGAIAFGYWVGAGAALLMALEYDVVTWSAGGWRDDAFTLGVVVTAIALLHFRRTPGSSTGFVLGLACGAACLIRITSLSFILPSLALLVVRAGRFWRERRTGIAVSLAVAGCVTAPYLWNCWKVYGDPFYSINVHASVYQETEGRPGDPSLTVRGYLGRHLRSSPVRTTDTMVQGLTVYPFTNKWTGFDVWIASAGRWLSIAAIAGLLLFAASPDGRLLLVVLATSLVPYAATWRLIADWRFTQHAYPFFLIATCVPLAWMVTAAVHLRRGQGLTWGEARTGTLWVGAMTVSLALVWSLMTWVVPAEIVKEALRAGTAATITAGDRDAAFFRRGWTAGPAGVVPTRVTSQQRAEIALPLPEVAAYEILLRVDPSTGPIVSGAQVAEIQLLLNGRLISRCDPGSTPERIGICRIRVPPESVRAGSNRLTLVTDPGQGSGFRVAYVRIEPVPQGRLASGRPRVSVS